MLNQIVWNTVHLYKLDFALNNLLILIYYKTQPPDQPIYVKMQNKKNIKEIEIKSKTWMGTYL